MIFFSGVLFLGGRFVWSFVVIFFFQLAQTSNQFYNLFSVKRMNLCEHASPKKPYGEYLSMRPVKRD